MNLQEAINSLNSQKLIFESEEQLYEELLNELAIQFGGRKQTQFNQVLILAGGAGSGKGFIKNNMVDLAGKTFDVDELKKAVMDSEMMFRDKKIKDMNLDLKKPKDVKLLHNIVSVEFGLDRKLQSTMFKSIMAADPRRKPNLIFDVTLKDLKKLKNISDNVQQLGYDKKDIHIVWVLTKLNVAMKQNLERDRVVPEDILMDTHRGVANVMKGIFSGLIQARTYMDGYFFIVPNVQDVDNEVKFSGNIGDFFNRGKEKGGYFFFKKADTYFKIKDRGSKFISWSDFSDKLKQKIKQYIPKGTTFDNNDLE